MRSFEPINKPDEDIIITPETTLVGMDILDIISRHVLSYPDLLRFISNEFYSPSLILTPAGIDTIEAEINSDSMLYVEVMTFIDTITLLSVLNYNDGNSIMNTFINSVKLSRDTTELGKGTNVMEEKQRSRNLLSSRGQSQSLYETVFNNKPIMGIYIFALVCNLYNIVLDTGK